MKLFSVIATLLFASASLAFAQPPDTLWTRTYGGVARDVFYSVAATSDGGFIATGDTWSFGAGGRDVYAVKTDSSGNVQWSHTWGTIYGDGASKVLALSDGYVIAGIFGGTPPIPPEPSLGWILRLDLSGDTLWSKWRGYGEGGYTFFLDVIRTSDGGFIGAGQSAQNGPDVWLMKMDANGDSVWSRSYGGPGWEYGSKVLETADGNFAVIGLSSSYGAGSDDMWLLKVSANGDSLWSHTFGGPSWEEAMDFCVAPDGGFVLVGYTASYSHAYDSGWIVKTDSLGNHEWSHVCPEAFQVKAYSVLSDGPSGFLVSGFYSTDVGLSDAWLMKLSWQGDSLWYRRWSQDHFSNAFSMAPLAHGGLILAGQASYQNSTGTGDGWLLRIASETTSVPHTNSPPPSSFILSVFPNPANGPVTLSLSPDWFRSGAVEISVFNLLGETVWKQRAFSASGTIRLANDRLTSGLYFLHVSNSRHAALQKLLILK